MSILILSALLIRITSRIIIARNPLIIGVHILIFALSISIIYRLLISSWIAFLLFLIYVRGILVIFSYFMSLTPNQTISSKSFIPPFTSIIAFSILLYFSTDLWIPYPNHQSNIIQFLFTTSNYPLLIILTFILFFTIVVVVKTAQLAKGPIRSFISYV